MNYREIQIKDYSYELPDNRIAKYPLKERDSSKLLVYLEGNISEDIYRNIEKYIPENSLLIFNDTKVIHARIYFHDPVGGKIEIFCLEPADQNTDPILLMARNKTVSWKCLVGRAAKWKEKILYHQSGKLTISAKQTERVGDTFIIEFNWQPENLSFAEVLEQVGEIPIPPYLNRKTEEIDLDRYQTVYAKQNGSVAAPTAGLHFTPHIFDTLNLKRINNDYVTLHVGAGTFKPVKSESMQEHEMHAEWIDVKFATIENILHKLTKGDNNGKIIAVGTTSLRTLESIYWMGVKASNNLSFKLPDLEIKQWDPYELQNDLNAVDALNSLLIWMKQNKKQRLVCKTQIIIIPSYNLKIADALITNFHQTNSTLLLLVAAVTGHKWKTIYEYAINQDFRFLSYGDGSLLFKDDKSKKLNLNDNN